MDSRSRLWDQFPRPRILVQAIGCGLSAKKASVMGSAPHSRNRLCVQVPPHRVHGALDLSACTYGLRVATVSADLALRIPGSTEAD